MDLIKQFLIFQTSKNLKHTLEKKNLQQTGKRTSIIVEINVMSIGVFDCSNSSLN